MNPLDRCTQEGCDAPVYATLVWPGRGRVAYCAAHAAKAVTVWLALDVSAESLDIRAPEEKASE
jgi:hypothetical protein